MKLFWSLAAYAAIGGLLYGLVFNEYKAKCPHANASDREVAYFAAAWPAFVVASLVIHDMPPSKCPPSKEPQP